MRQECYETGGTVDHGHLTVTGKRLFHAALQRFPDGAVIVSVKVARPSRSSQQNRYYWAVVLPPIADYTGYTVDETHEVLKQMFLPKQVAVCDGNGEVVGAFVIGGSTTRLTRAAFTEYLERIREFARERLSVEIPDAHEVAA